MDSLKTWRRQNMYDKYADLIRTREMYKALEKHNPHMSFPNKEKEIGQKRDEFNAAYRVYDRLR